MKALAAILCLLISACTEAKKRSIQLFNNGLEMEPLPGDTSFAEFDLAIPMVIYFFSHPEGTGAVSVSLSIPRTLDEYNREFGDLEEEDLLIQADVSGDEIRRKYERNGLVSGREIVAERVIFTEWATIAVKGVAAINEWELVGNDIMKCVDSFALNMNGDIKFPDYGFSIHGSRAQLNAVMPNNKLLLLKMSRKKTYTFMAAGASRVELERMPIGTDLNDAKESVHRTVRIFNQRVINSEHGPSEWKAEIHGMDQGRNKARFYYRAIELASGLVIVATGVVHESRAGKDAEVIRRCIEAIRPIPH